MAVWIDDSLSEMNRWLDMSSAARSGLIDLWCAHARELGAGKQETDWVWSIQGLLRPRPDNSVVSELVLHGWVEPNDGGYVLVDHGLIGVGRGPRERPRYRNRISPEVRAFVYARDGHKCVECGATDDLTLDHIYPWSLGGSDDESNLRTLCRSCNSKKGARV